MIDLALRLVARALRLCRMTDEQFEAMQAHMAAVGALDRVAYATPDAMVPLRTETTS